MTAEHPDPATSVISRQGPGPTRQPRLAVRRTATAMVLLLAGCGSLVACGQEGVPEGGQVSATRSASGPLSSADGAPSPTVATPSGPTREARSPEPEESATPPPEQSKSAKPRESSTATPEQTKSAKPQEPSSKAPEEPTTPEARPSATSAQPAPAQTSFEATEAPTPLPTASAAASEESGSGSWIWLGLAVLAAAIAAVIAVVVGRKNRTRAWHDRVIAARQSAEWLNNMYLPGLLSTGSVTQLQQYWQEGVARFDSLEAELTDLRVHAADQQQAAAVETLRVALAGLRQSASHVVYLAEIGAPNDVQGRAASEVQNARAAVTSALWALPRPAAS